MRLACRTEQLAFSCGPLTSAQTHQSPCSAVVRAPLPTRAGANVPAIRSCGTEYIHSLNKQVCASYERALPPSRIKSAVQLQLSAQVQTRQMLLPGTYLPHRMGHCRCRTTEAATQPPRPVTLWKCNVLKRDMAASSACMVSSKLLIFWLAIFLLALCIHAHLHLDGLLPDGQLLLHNVPIAPSARIPVRPVLVSHLPVTAHVSKRCSVAAPSYTSPGHQAASQLIGIRPSLLQPLTVRILIATPYQGALIRVPLYCC